MKKKLKIAFCTDGIYPMMIGGMQKHSARLITALAESDEIELLVIHPHEKKLFSSPGIQEYPVKGISPRANYLREAYRYSRRVYEQLKVLQPDVIYSQGLSVWYRAKDFSAILMINPHGLESFQSKKIKDLLVGLPFRVIFRHLFHRSRLVVSLGGKLTTILKDIKGIAHKIVEIPNGVDVDSEVQRGIKQGQPLHVLFMARFAANKGIDILFKAIQWINENGHAGKFSFTLAGTGPLYEKYRDRKLPSNVVLAGHIADEGIAHLYRSADVFVLPTLFEGMPTVILEAMSFGLPVIVSDVGATSIMVDEQTGLLVISGSVSDLINALMTVGNLTQQQRYQMGEAAFQKVNRQFNWRIIAQAYVSHFRHIATAG